MKDTFDKVVMDEARQQEIRSELMGKKSAKKTWLAPVIAIAAAITVIMIVPGTREIVVKAAEKIYGTFTATFNNLSISIEETSYTRSDGGEVYRINTTYDFGNFEPWGQVKDGRLYFVLDGKWEDVTDKCVDDNYFRYEQEGENGYKTIFYVGGTPDSFGWGQVVRKEDGEVIEGMMVFDENNMKPKWYKHLMAKENIPSAMMPTFTYSEYADMVSKEITYVYVPLEDEDN